MKVSRTRLLAALALSALLLPLATSRPISGARSLQQDTDSVWLNYTNEPNTFYLGPVVIDASAADSDASCAARCNADATCVWWSFCPVLEGCEALAYCNVEDAATTQLLPGGTCLLSADDVRGRIANSAMSGAAVAWSGGKYSPQAGSGDAAGGLGTESGTAMPPEGDISSLSDIADLLFGGGGGGRRLRQAGSTAPAPQVAATQNLSDPIWDTFAFYPASFARGPDVLNATLADTPEQCAATCGEDPRCRQWAWCPAEATDGCEALETCDLSANAIPTRVAPGTCLPSYDAAAGGATGRTAYLLLRAEGLPWAAGDLRLGGAPAGAPSAAPSPDLSPDLSPEPASPSPSPDLSPEPSSPEPSSPSPSPSPEPSSPSPSPAAPTPNGQCPEGTKNCGGSNGLLCILTNQDRMNCGTCGFMCGPSESCIGGICMCPGGGRKCGTSCANILLDTYNCGFCGNACSLGQSCMGGVCY